MKITTAGKVKIGRMEAIFHFSASSPISGGKFSGGKFWTGPEMHIGTQYKAMAQIAQRGELLYV